MDGWLKGLIAVTCAVVIGGIGYFVVTDSAARKADQARGPRELKFAKTGPCPFLKENSARMTCSSLPTA